MLSGAVEIDASTVPQPSANTRARDGTVIAPIPPLPEGPVEGWSAVLLAAGRGTRMRSTLPKVLHPVAGRPMVRLICETLSNAGLSRIVVVAASDTRESITQAVTDSTVGEISPLTTAPIVVEQAEQLGTGHAALCGRTAVGETRHVLIAYGDLPLLTTRTLRELMARHVSTSATLTFLTARLNDPTGYGRVIRQNGRVQGIVEESETDASTRGEPEVNAGLYAIRAEWLWTTLDGLGPGTRGEVYLTDLIARAVTEGELVQTSQVGEASEVRQVNTRVELAAAEQTQRDRVRHALMESGVTLMDPASTFVDVGVEVGADSTLWPGVHLTGKTRIGVGCEIGPHSVLYDMQLGARCRVEGSTLRSSTLANDVEIGPYCVLRSGCTLGEQVHLGSYAELKNAKIGAGTKIGHFAYIGDSMIGTNVNVGAGTVTANYDGNTKHLTQIGDDAFIGSGTTLVAPVTIGDGAFTGAGAVVTHDVAPGERVAGMPARVLPRVKDSDQAIEADEEV